ncbi:MAG TPA: thiolase family protein [Candidatus Acidoferrum sp.]|nr:thiolase family protein [Candidatus Acidoferrum sp.]
MEDVLEATRIVGVHTTEVRRSLAPRTGFSLALESLKGALDDAGMAIHDLDGIYACISDWPLGVSSDRVGAFLARQLNTPLAIATSRFGIEAILEAASAIAAGVVTTAAVIVGQCRTQRPEDTAIWARPTHQFTEWTGSFTAVQYALVAQRYVHEYGSSAIDAMAEASATIRNYGSINPDAVYFGRGPYTAEDVLASRPIASPLTLLMCSAVTDGGHAVILTSKDRAADTPKQPIRIVTGGSQVPYPPYHDAPVLDAVEDDGKFVRTRLARAGIRHDDIDVVELYDHFSIGVLMEFELYGFCERGEAADFIRSGVMALDGRFPTCTDGGNHSYAHNGVPLLYRVIEGIRQIRNEVKDLCEGSDQGVHSHEPGKCRAVRNAELAFVSNPGPPTGGGSFLVLSPGGDA